MSGGNKISMDAERELSWQGSSLEDLRGFPEDVQDAMGFALSEVQVVNKLGHRVELRIEKQVRPAEEAQTVVSAV